MTHEDDRDDAARWRGTVTIKLEGTLTVRCDDPFQVVTEEHAKAWAKKRVQQWVNPLGPKLTYEVVETKRD